MIVIYSLLDLGQSQTFDNPGSVPSTLHIHRLLVNDREMLMFRSQILHKHEQRAQSHECYVNAVRTDPGTESKV